MSHLVLTIGPAHTLRQAARMMSARHIGRVPPPAGPAARRYAGSDRGAGRRELGRGPRGGAGTGRSGDGGHL